MGAFQVEVSSKVVGETDESLKLAPVWVLVDEDTITAQKIIALAVEEQINSLVPKNRKVDLKKARRMLIRQYMSQSDLEEEAPGTTNETEQDIWKQEIDIKKEIKRATEAFKDGRVVMLIGGEQVHNLDDQIIMAEEMEVKFIRLTPLVGG
jgi:hypothetical protein